MKRISILLLVLYVIPGCNQITNQTEKLKSEVIETEKAFADMAEKSGIPMAFLHFADENAVLERNNGLINGKTAIKLYFDKQDLSNVKLTWTPDFVEVSASGDLAYTYGSYVFSTIDEKGNEVKKTGIFHTVWKKQLDGSWRFVWD
jgi:ketosteroid isomerase-like protein